MAMGMQLSKSLRFSGSWEGSMASVLFGLFSLLQGTLFICLAYQYFLVLASIREPDHPTVDGVPSVRFAIAIPAHNEASVLAATLQELSQLDYPPELFDVHVVADHCTDNTAQVAQQGGAIVHERAVLPKGRKAYALQWLLDRILSGDVNYDAVVVFDADSRVERGFLTVMAGYLLSGALVLQGQHRIINPQDSFLASMAAVDMRLNNRLRNQGRSNLGFACRLMGDAMVFHEDVLRKYGWLAESLTEDREYGYVLLTEGIRAQYVPQALSLGEAASSWKQAEPQRLRWYRGLIDMQRRLATRLIGSAVRLRSFALLDGAIELLMPSYSSLAAVALANLTLVVAFGVWLPLDIRTPLGVLGSALLVTAWIAYPFLGLIVDRAPGWAYKALLLGPVYLVWRLWISVLVRLRGDRTEWIRTLRRDETK